MKLKVYEFSAEIKIIGINPYVSVPDEILARLFIDAGKDKGHIPIKGKVNEKPYVQTLVRYSGEWRLYINTTMLKYSPKKIGETLAVTIAFDPDERKIEAHPKFVHALSQNAGAKAVFDNLSPSRQLEIIRYIANLKNEQSIDNNVLKAVMFLSGKGRFVGRQHP